MLLCISTDIAAAPFYDSVDLPTFIGEAFRKDPWKLDREFSRNDSVGDGMRSRVGVVSVCTVLYPVLVINLVHFVGNFMFG